MYMSAFYSDVSDASKGTSREPSAHSGQPK